MMREKEHRSGKRHASAQVKLFIVLCLTIIPPLFMYMVAAEYTGSYYSKRPAFFANFKFNFMLAGLIFTLTLMVFGIRKKMIDTMSTIIAIVLIFYMIPEAVATGSRLGNCSGLWFATGVMYVVIMMRGLKRYIFLALDALWICFFYWDAYNYGTYYEIPRKVNDIYALVTVLIVSSIVAIVAAYEIRLQRIAFGEIEKQAKEIELLNRTQNNFFSSMSHEIRTPINTILGLNEITLRENVSEEINENSASIQSAGKMLLHLINDILDMSKFESGQMSLTPVNYHTGDMLSDVVGMLWLNAKKKNLEFHVNVAPDLPSELIGDEVRIKQILINVLNNAIKYTNEGSVTLTIQCERKKPGYADVIYSVTDTGMGIKKESIPYLFTAFKRVDEEKNRYIEGTGLGLSIVKEFVDLMGGKITVNSVYTKGSTFVIEIPQKIANDTAIGEIGIEEHKNLGHRTEYHRSFEAPDARILVVDDTEANLMVVEKLLRDTRVKIDTASSGEEALKKTLEEEYHVIFMDHLMPGMNGIECMHNIKKQTGGLSKEARIVALTANVGSESAALYAKEGFDGYVVKPVSGQALEMELKKQLPSELVTLTGSAEEVMEESLLWNSEDVRKASVVITSESVADLPKAVAEKLNIVLLPHKVRMENGLFMDGIEIEQQGLLAYMRKNVEKVLTQAPTVEEHEAFFAKQLVSANNVVHISISSKVAESGCPAAIEASGSFDNVFVVDTGHLSSGQGLIAMEAARMAQEGLSAEDIVERLEGVKKRVHTSFVVDNLDYLARCGQVSSRIAGITKAFMIRPVLMLKKGVISVGRAYIGSRESAWKSYIDSCLSDYNRIDKRTLFVTYVGLTQNDLRSIKKLIDAKGSFENIYFQKASPAIAVNCGPGTFGLLYLNEE